MKQSDFLKLNWRDFLKGLVIAILTPVFTTAYDSFLRGEFTLNWHLILVSAIGGAGAYLSKNLFTSAEKPNIQKMLDEQNEDVGIPKPRP